MMEDRDIEEFHNIGKPIKFHNKYKYIQGKQLTDPGSGTRVYDIDGGRLPSVTTILGATANKQFLKDWIAKKGEQEATRIKNLSSNRGTAMHKFLEHYILGTGYDDLTAIGQAAKPMAQKIIEIGLAPVEEYYGSEVMLHYPGLYAGSTDLVCLHNGKETIVDFKQANRPKKEEWIGDYYKQIAAYTAMVYEMTNIVIRKGIIAITVEGDHPQIFAFNPWDYLRELHLDVKRYEDMIV